MNQKFSTYLKASLLAIALVVGLTTLQANWTPPPAGVTPPNGNPAVPINTSATIQTKAVGGDICIEKVAGTVKCMSTMTPLVPTGSVTPSAGTCTIASGASTCTVNFTWNISNANTPNLYNTTRNIQYSTLAAGTAQSYAVTNGANTIQVRDGTSSLGTATVTGNCITNTGWDVPTGKCAPVPGGTISAPTASCSITAGNSTCVISLTWTTNIYVTSPSIWNSTDSALLSTAANGTAQSFSIKNGTKTIHVRDGSSSLNNVNVTASCTSGTVYNAGTEKCDGASATLGFAPGWGNCTIADDASTCMTGLVWNIVNVTPTSNANVVNVTTNTTYSTTGQTTNAGTQYSIAYGPNNIEARNGVTALASLAVSASCGSSNAFWSGSACVPAFRFKKPRSFVGGFYSTAVANGKIYVFGGYNGTTLASVGEYDPVANTWVERNNMSVARYFYTNQAATLGGKIYLMGGDNSLSNKNEEYNPLTGVWASKAVIPPASGVVAWTAPVASDGTSVYLVGPYATQVFTPNAGAGTWATKPAPSKAMTEGVVYLSGKIYKLGGADTNEVFNISLGTWSSLPANPLGSTNLTAYSVVEANGLIYVSNGRGCNFCGGSSYNYSFNPSTSAWKARVPIGSRESSGVASYGGKIYFIGSWPYSGNSSADVIEYDPAKDLTP